MRKIYTLLLMLVIALTLSACGPNSDYYRIPGAGGTFIIQMDVDNESGINIDPYVILRTNRDLIEGFPEYNVRDLKDKFDVKVEYRVSGYNAFKEFVLVNGKIYEDQPIQVKGAPDTILFANKTYDFKLHFIDKETGSEKDMINLYVTYEFKPAYKPKENPIYLDLNEVYDLMDNVRAYDEKNIQMTKEQLLEKFNVTYSFSTDYEGQEPVSAITVENNSISFSTAVTYYVKIVLVDKSAGNDTTAGASPGAGAGGAETHTVIYKITTEAPVVEE